MELLIVFVIIIVGFVAVFFFFAFLFTALEHRFAIIFHRPFFVHFYWKLKKLTPSEHFILRTEFPFYKTLSPREKLYFEHRLHQFIDRYDFIGKDMVVDNRVKVLVGATSTMLTFGMREYLYDVISRIIIYPGPYFSTSGDAYHKGEFNPAAKAIVFSWADFEKGFKTDDDNINLGIHEFAHVLHFQCAKQRNTSAIIFTRMFNKIAREVHYPANTEMLVSSSYFRIYAYTNQFEFLAVIIEHFFESPQLFNAEFPQLFKNVCRMLNHYPLKRTGQKALF